MDNRFFFGLLASIFSLFLLVLIGTVFAHGVPATTWATGVNAVVAIGTLGVVFAAFRQIQATRRSEVISRENTDMQIVVATAIEVCFRVQGIAGKGKWENVVAAVNARLSAESEEEVGKSRDDLDTIYRKHRIDCASLAGSLIELYKLLWIPRAIRADELNAVMVSIWLVGSECVSANRSLSRFLDKPSDKSDDYARLCRVYPIDNRIHFDFEEVRDEDDGGLAWPRISLESLGEDMEKQLTDAARRFYSRS